MRIIINTNIFTTEEYSKLTKEDFTKICNIVAVFAKEDTDKVPLFKITGAFDITEDFINKSSFCLDYFDDHIEIKNYFTWLKGNKSAVAKHRMLKKSNSKVQSISRKAKEPVVTAIVEEVKQEDDKSRIEYNKVREIFNECFRGTKVPLVKLLTDARRKKIKTFYDKFRKELVEDTDIYEFYELYFDLIKDVGDTQFNLVKGWNNNRSDSWFQPDFDYFLKDKVFVQLREKVK